MTLGNWGGRMDSLPCPALVWAASGCSPAAAISRQSRAAAAPAGPNGLAAGGRTRRVVAESLHPARGSPEHQPPAFRSAGSALREAPAGVGRMTSGPRPNVFAQPEVPV